MAVKYYAVKKGFKTGIFNSWNECKQVVNGYSGAIYKSFEDIEEAKSFLQKGSELLQYLQNSYKWIGRAHV